MLVLPNDGYIQQWKDIIDNVDKEVVPMEFVKCITYFDHIAKEEQFINVATMREYGINEEEIQDLIFEEILKNNDATTMDFSFDIDHIAKAVEKETTKILKNM